MEAEKKLEELGLSLPPIPTPVANYLPLVRTGNLLFVSGHGPGVLKDGSVSFIQGKLGKDLDVEQGYDAAQTGHAQYPAIPQARAGRSGQSPQSGQAAGLCQLHARLPRPTPQ